MDRPVSDRDTIVFLHFGLLRRLSESQSNGQKSIAGPFLVSLSPIETSTGNDEPQPTTRKDD